MTIYHLLPKDEAELHDHNTDCACNPALILEERKLEGQVLFLHGNTAFEHFPFSPLAERYGVYEVVKEKVT